MPRKPEIKDYSKTIIYQIVCNDSTITESYVGHTTNFELRKEDHRNICKNEKSKKYNSGKYIFIRNNGGWENWSMIEIEIYPCNSSTEARIREEYWRNKLQANLNAQRAYVSTEMYKNEMKEYRIEYYKIYDVENKEKIKKYHQEWYEKKKEEILNNQKIYYENNKEHVKELRKKQYLKHKEKINERACKQYTCDCGSIIRKDSKTNHEKTKKHQEYLTTIGTPCSATIT
jgi:hypothetical protein